MPFVYLLFTPGVAWSPPESINLAINSQAGVQARAVQDAGQLRVTSSRGQVALAGMSGFDRQEYEPIARKYRHQMTDRDRETALPFERKVVLTTTGAADAEGALFHVAVADGLWWLLGGFLADPAAGILWGWRGWREAGSMARHSGELLGRPVPTLPLAPTLAGGESSRRTAGSSTAITLYTLPYCPDCRAVRNHLRSRGVPYDEIDVAVTPGAVQAMVDLADGKRSTPTLQVGR